MNKSMNKPKPKNKIINYYQITIYSIKQNGITYLKIKIKCLQIIYYRLHIKYLSH